MACFDDEADIAYRDGGADCHPLFGQVRTQAAVTSTENDPNVHGILVALRLKLWFVAKLMRDLELEMASLPSEARNKRMPEFDARVTAITENTTNIESAAKAFLFNGGYRGGSA